MVLVRPRGLRGHLRHVARGSLAADSREHRRPLRQPRARRQGWMEGILPQVLAAGLAWALAAAVVVLAAVGVLGELRGAT